MRRIDSYNATKERLISDGDLEFVNEALVNCPESHFGNEQRKILGDIASSIIANADQPKIDESYQFAEFTGNPLAVALGFYQQIGNPLMADRAQALLDGLDDRFDVVLAADKHSTGFVKTTDQKSTIYINQNRTTEDIFTAIHEIAHPFDLDDQTSNGSNPTRDVLGEVTPIALELIACSQLTKTGAINPLDAKSKIAELHQATYYNATETKLRLDLLDKTQRSWTGKISHRDFTETVEQLGIDDESLHIFLNRAASHIRADYRPYRYMIARLLSPKIYRGYQDNPSATMACLNDFQNAVSNDNLSLALRSIDVRLDDLNLAELAGQFDKINPM